jgi:TM2 domain-containing membrane protein YozV
MSLQDRNGRVSGDARAMMLFEANKKSLGVAYLLWFLLGFFGGHRFYSGKVGTAVFQLILMLIGLLLTLIYLGWLIILPLVVWVLIDAFLIPGWIRNHNALLAVQLGHS